MRPRVDRCCSSGYELGENLFYSSSQYSWTVVISNWHREAANFLYLNGSVNGGLTGHYTQVTAARRYGYQRDSPKQESIS